MRLKQVLEQIRAAGLKLNKDKCKFRQRQICFLEHVFTEDGVKPHLEKVAGINKFPQPQNMTELMVNYMAKLIPELSTTG